MLDELEHLRTNANLQQLLAHYVRLAAPDRDIWQERLMSLDGVDAAGMTSLHGLLLAFGWIEWTSARNDQKWAACYRATLDGIRALRLIAGGSSVVEEEPPSAEEAVVKVPRRKRARKAVDVVASA